MLIQALLTATVLNIKQLARRGPVAQSGVAVIPVPTPALSPLLAMWSHFLRIFSAAQALPLGRPGR